MKIIIDLDELEDLLDELEGSEENYARINKETKNIDLYEILGNDYATCNSYKYNIYTEFRGMKVEFNGNV